jgi:hypothetical protein
VKLGQRWVLLETGQSPFSAERAAAWLERSDPGSEIAAALVTAPAAGNGGAAWLAARNVPIHAAPGAMPFLATILRNHRQPAAAASVVARAQWRHIGGDSLWVEPIDLPDAPGSLLVYVPSLGWAYSAMAAGPLQAEYLMRRVKDRGWTVQRIGSMRAIAVPAPK